MRGRIGLLDLSRRRLWKKRKRRGPIRNVRKAGPFCRLSRLPNPIGCLPKPLDIARTTEYASSCAYYQSLSRRSWQHRGGCVWLLGSWLSLYSVMDGTRGTQNKMQENMQSMQLAACYLPRCTGFALLLNLSIYLAQSPSAPQEKR